MQLAERVKTRIHEDIRWRAATAKTENFVTFRKIARRQIEAAYTTTFALGEQNIFILVICGRILLAAFKILCRIIQHECYT
jgi:hypothetical protein